MNVCTLISIISNTSTQGMMKKTPGPRAPSDNRSPSRKMTPLSYSWNKSCQKIIHSITFTTWTTFTTNRRERGKVTKMKKTEKMTIRWAIKPWPSSQAKQQYPFLYTQRFLRIMQISDFTQTALIPGTLCLTYLLLGVVLFRHFPGNTFL